MRLPSSICRIWNDEALRYPIVVGGLSIPVILSLQGIPLDEYTYLVPVVVGIFLGAWFAETSTSGRRVGLRAGLVAGFSIVFSVLQIATLVPYDAQPLWATGYAAVGFVFVAAAGILVFGAFGWIGGLVGERLFDGLLGGVASHDSGP